MKCVCIDCKVKQRITHPFLLKRGIFWHGGRGTATNKDIDWDVDYYSIKYIVRPIVGHLLQNCEGPHTKWRPCEPAEIHATEEEEEKIKPRRLSFFLRA